MSDPKTYVCARCGREHVARCLVPEGWEWRGARLFCDDCQRLSPNGAPPEPLPSRSEAEPDETLAMLMRAGVMIDPGDPAGDRCATIVFQAGEGWRIVALHDRSLVGSAGA